MCDLNHLFWGIAGGASAFYGVRAVHIDTVDCNYLDPKFAEICNYIYVFVFHLFGSMIGWSFIYLLYHNTFENPYTYVNLIFLVFGYLGVTGHIPQTLYGFVKAFGQLVNAGINKIK